MHTMGMCTWVIDPITHENVKYMLTGKPKSVKVEMELCFVGGLLFFNAVHELHQSQLLPN